ncbi:MAG: HDOD domain-containing protein [Planctomycetia bacterium]|nr:HDOD domain-containing protein [Planctomycetia bacterium]
MAIDWGKLLDSALGDFTIAALPPTLSLPALPVAVTQFIEKSNDPRIEIKDLAKIVETDSGLTIELLKHVNSAYVGARVRVASAGQALAMLGLAPSRNLLITVGTKAAIQARQSKLINQSCFWNAALQKAIFAREIARMLKADYDLAFNGALLQDYLLPVVTNELYDHYVEFIKARDQHPVDICQFEQQSFEWDHAIAGACLARRWKLPDELVGCILFHHAGIEILSDPDLGRTAAAAVALSALLPDQLRQCYQGLEQLVVVEQAWPALNLKAVAETVDAQHEAAGLGVRNDFPLMRRCRTIFGQTPVAAAASA